MLKLVATGALALAVFSGGSASASTVRNSFIIDPPAPDQIVLTSSCVSSDQIQAAAQEALAYYYANNGPGMQPAGVWLVNPGPVQAGANWVPAVLASQDANQLAYCV